MLSVDFSRRELLRAAGVTGIVAVSTVRLPQTAAAAIAPKDRPPMAALAARVRMRPDGSAAIALASAQMGEGLEVIWQPGGSHEDSGSPNRVASPWACRQQAYDTARALLLATAAQSWDVGPAECRAEGGQIIHPRSGRAVGYVIWTEFG